jgi:predicted transcriptional regulator
MHNNLDISKKNEDEETLLSYQYILGEMGIQILVAIYRGATSQNAIQLLSGVPISCVKGRLPVLINLNLIVDMQEEYYITEKGNKFLKL